MSAYTTLTTTLHREPIMDVDYEGNPVQTGEYIVRGQYGVTLSDDLLTVEGRELMLVTLRRDGIDEDGEPGTEEITLYADELDPLRAAIEGLTAAVSR